MARAFLDQVAVDMPVPDDWIYIHNFKQPDRPLALNLPAGQGRVFAAEMDSLVDQARQQIGHAFETERYAERRQQLAGQLGRKRVWGVFIRSVFRRPALARGIDYLASLLD